MREVLSSTLLEAEAPILEAMSTVFESLGRGLLCLDRGFHVLHAGPGLDAIVGPGAAERAVGRSAQELLGEDLFAPGRAFRQALESGERREGWGAALVLSPAAPRRVSLTAAPLRREMPEACDPRVAYVFVVRPADDDIVAAGGAAPTVFAGMIARSPAMLAMFRLIENLEESEATVLLTGESGTGKELVARAIHLHSPRRNGPFLAVNCGAIPAELMESELFGHVRGAFTGAVRDRIGRFEAASEGTLFLDEVGDLPLPLQVKLLRVLQERTFEPVGQSRSKTTEARVIAATNIDLKRAVAEGRFREDLFYRLRVVPMEVPPLRQRREDIEPLAKFLLSRVAARNGRSLMLAQDALQAILRYSWPGNVRELENALEYAVAVSRAQTVHAEALPPEVLAGDSGAGSLTLLPRLGEQEASERERLKAALESHRWRREEAARSLGMSRTTLWRKMRELGLARRVRGR